MIYFIRHSERQDFVDVKKWEKSKRYQEHGLDPPLTLNGKQIASNTIKIILDNVGNKLPKYIYSSPATRCVETSLSMQKYIKKKYNVLPEIRIENGLLFFDANSTIWWFNRDNIKYKNNYFEISYDKEIIDDKMTAQYYEKLYPDSFDVSYKSIIKRDIINKEKSYKSLNTRIKCLLKLFLKCDEELNILCTHGENLGLIKSFLNKKWNPEDRKQFTGHNWCSWMKIVNNKIVETSK
jgi:hypothetical protein